MDIDKKLMFLSGVLLLLSLPILLKSQGYIFWIEAKILYLSAIVLMFIGSRHEKKEDL